MNGPLHDQTIVFNYHLAAQLMSHLAFPGSGPPEADERFSIDLRAKLHECLLEVKEPVLRRQLRVLASAHGIGDLSTLFPAQPISDTPLEELAVDVTPMMDIVLRMTRSQAAKFLEETVKVGRTAAGQKKYGRSDDYLGVFEDAGKAMRRLATKASPELRQAVADAVRKSRESGEYPAVTKDTPPEKPVFGLPEP